MRKSVENSIMWREQSLEILEMTEKEVADYQLYMERIWREWSKEYKQVEQEGVIIREDEYTTKVNHLNLCVRWIY